MRSLLFVVILVAAAGCSQQQPPPPSRAASQPAGSGASASIDAGGGTTVTLPRKVSAEWTRPETGRRITADTIFDYMDGAGEMYLAYRFDHLDVFEFRSPDPSLGTILVELYVMKSPTDAFGLLSTDWTGEPVPGPPDTSPPDEQHRIRSVPEHQALFGAGLLRLWSGNLYARVLASRDTPVTRDAVLAIGRALTGGRAVHPPQFAASLPVTTAGWPRENEKPGAPIRADRTCFFRSHLVLNSQYFLASQDILGLGADVSGLTSEYAPDRPGARPLRLIVVRYPTPERAAAARESFLKAYLPGAAASGDRGAAKTEHGWVAYAVHGPGLAVALDAADPVIARKLTNQAAYVRAPDSVAQ